MNQDALAREADRAALEFLRGQVRLLRAAGVVDHDCIRARERTCAKLERHLAPSPAEPAERRVPARRRTAPRARGSAAVGRGRAARRAQ